MLELEELGRELDVGERPSAQLEVELRIVPGRQPLAFDAGLHAPHLAHVLVAERPPHMGLDDLHEAPTDIDVTGDGPGT